MSHLTVFLNNTIDYNTGVSPFADALIRTGNKGLAPFRYLFNGKNITIHQLEEHRGTDLREIVKKTIIKHTHCFPQQVKGTMRDTARAVALLVPGLLLAMCKVFAYFFSHVREGHRLAKQHLTPVELEIGEDRAIENRENLKIEIEDAIEDGFANRQITALIIHGNGNLIINEDPGILKLNPMKLILKGAKIGYQTSPTEDHLSTQMCKTGKWQVSKQDKTKVVIHKTTSIEAALRATAPKEAGFFSNRLHTIFQVVPPKK